MALLTNEQKARMLANGRAAAEAIAEDEDIAFGLCDLGFGCPELGSVRLSELEAVRGPGGLAVERDLHFRPTKSLTAYAAEANRFGRIRA